MLLSLLERVLDAEYDVILRLLQSSRLMQFQRANSPKNVSPQTQTQTQLNMTLKYIANDRTAG